MKIDIDNSMSEILLIYPPVAKPSEPPAGIAQLAGVLKGHGVGCNVADLNLEGLDFILKQQLDVNDTWSLRAGRHVEKNRVALSTLSTYQNFDRYKRAVADVNRVVEVVGKSRGLALSLANYQDEKLSPLRSQDLLGAAAHPEANIYYPFFSQRLPELCDLCKPLFIGFSLNYLSQALTTFAMIGFCRQRFPELKIVVGGGLITSWSSRPGWNNPFCDMIDHLIAGPGEGKLLELLGAESLDSHFQPDYSKFSELKYLAPGRILPYAASSGCYWNRCTFCPEKAEGSRYLQVAPKIVLTELDQLLNETQCSLIHFLDNAMSPALLRALAKAPPGVEWYGFIRIEDDLLELDFCFELRRSGCVMLKLGVESGAPEVLQAMKKGIALERVALVLANLKRAGIATYVYLLFGTPSEALAEARQTLNFVAENHQAITFLNLAIFNLPLFSVESKGLRVRDFYAGDLSLYGDFIHPRDWQRKPIRNFLNQEFKRHPLIAPIIKCDPPIFTSNHAPFF